MAARTPPGLGPRGRRIWRETTTDHDLDLLSRELLLEACRVADRLDGLDAILRGDVDTWARLTHDTRTEDYELKIDAALSESRQLATVFKQLIASLRLPDEASGKRPQQRGGARGAYVPSGKGGPSKVSSLERARAARSS
jgi:hypothetical protein